MHSSSNYNSSRHYTLESKPIRRYYDNMPIVMHQQKQSQSFPSEYKKNAIKITPTQVPKPYKDQMIRMKKDIAPKKNKKALNPLTVSVPKTNVSQETNNNKSLNSSQKISVVNKMSLKPKKQMTKLECQENQYNFIVPEMAGKTSASESGQVKRIKKVTFLDECRIRTDDPTYNFDLMKSDQVAAIPLTKDEQSELHVLDERLNLVHKQWNNFEPIDPIVEDEMFWFDQVHNKGNYASNLNCQSGNVGSVLNNWNHGRHQSYFALPLMTELKCRFPSEILEHNVKMAMHQVTEEQMLNIDEEPPQFLVSWGVVPDVEAWNIRRNENNEEKPKLKSNSPNKKSSLKQMDQAKPIVQQNKTGLRAIVKKAHLNNKPQLLTPVASPAPISCKFSPDSGFGSPQDMTRTHSMKSRFFA